MGPFFVLSVSEKYNWHELKPIDLEVLREIREEVHLAIQHVAAVGRTFLEADSRDRNASLAWIPGLWRIAGKWVAGTHTFRSSLSFEDFSIYLVDEKVNPLASIHLDNKSHNQVLVWLEEHIINLDLSSSHLVMNLPYKLPESVAGKKTFVQPDELILKDLGGHFHNAFIVLSEYREKYQNSTEPRIWPKRFNIETRLILIQTDEEETDTYITLGFSPGDKYYEEPYFYVTSRPHVMEEHLPRFRTRGFWHKENWFGAIYFTRNLWDSTDQKSTAMYFFDEAITHFRKMLGK